MSFRMSEQDFRKEVLKRHIERHLTRYLKCNLKGFFVGIVKGIWSRMSNIPIFFRLNHILLGFLDNHMYCKQSKGVVYNVGNW